jgi:hypothetical protein
MGIAPTHERDGEFDAIACRKQVYKQGIADPVTIMMKREILRSLLLLALLLH